MLTPEMLADLRKKAEAACGTTQGPLECTDIGMERVADLEFIAAARAAGGGWVNGAMYGAPLVRALLNRIAELEAACQEAMAALKNAADGPRELQALDRAIEEQVARARERRGDPQ